jgi:hypothetical protein
MLEWWLLGGGCLAAMPYALLPLVIKASTTLSATPEFKAAAVDTLPSSASKFIQEKVPKLEKLGFKLCCVLECPTAGSHVQNYVALMTNEQEKIFALVTVIISPLADGDAIKTHYLELVTMYENEHSLSTLNSSELPGFPKTKENRKVQVPQIQDEVRLLAIHEAAARDFGKDKKTYLPKVEDWSAYTAEQVVKEYSKAVQQGYLFLDQTGKDFRTTWKGAYLMTWGQLWPVKPMREWLLAQGASRTESRYLPQP